MASFEGGGVRVIDKFNGENFNIYTFKLVVGLASVNFWDVVDEFDRAPPSNVDRKIKKEYQKLCQEDNLRHCLHFGLQSTCTYQSCKELTEVWKTLCNIDETKILLNIILVCCKFFMDKMQECDDLLNHVNKVKTLANQRAYLKISVRNKDIIMTLLESLSPTYKYLITTLKNMSMKEVSTEYVTTHLMHEMLKREEIETQCDDAPMVLC